MRSLCCLCLALLVGSCASYQSPPRNDHVVPAPISERANIVLQNLVLEYADTEGDWRGCLSPGCAAIWGTQLGYRAGLRRDRDDLVDLADDTADFQSSLLKSMAWAQFWGDEVENQEAAMSGFPAILLSATYGGDKIDAVIFSKGLAKLESGELPGLDARQSAGSAALLAAAAQAEPDRAVEHLEHARKLAAAATDGGNGTWCALAFAAIAKVSRAPEDIAAARQAVEACGYRVTPSTGEMKDPPVDGIQMLSRNLAMIHALADLATVTRDPKLHRSAVSLLDQTFTDTWFDGRFIKHDTQNIIPDHHCSGCQLWALYLVDRLYGDTFVIDPLPKVREQGPRVELAWYEKINLLFGLAEGTPEEPSQTTVSENPMTLTGTYGFEHGDGEIQLFLKYAIIIDWAFPPNGGLQFQAVGIRHGEKIEFKMSSGFDDSGVARATIGSAPLIADVVVTRLGEGEETTYRADIVLREK